MPSIKLFNNRTVRQIDLITSAVLFIGSIETIRRSNRAIDNQITTPSFALHHMAIGYLISDSMRRFFDRKYNSIIYNLLYALPIYISLEQQYGADVSSFEKTIIKSLFERFVIVMIMIGSMFRFAMIYRKNRKI
jgi:hypothetical protein